MNSPLARNADRIALAITIIAGILIGSSNMLNSIHDKQQREYVDVELDRSNRAFANTQADIENTQALVRRLRQRAGLYFCDVDKRVSLLEENQAAMIESLVQRGMIEIVEPEPGIEPEPTPADPLEVPPLDADGPANPTNPDSRKKAPPFKTVAYEAKTGEKLDRVEVWTVGRNESDYFVMKTRDTRVELKGDHFAIECELVEMPGDYRRRLTHAKLIAFSVNGGLYRDISWRFISDGRSKVFTLTGKLTYDAGVNP